jgi:hypothetical protein
MYEIILIENKLIIYALGNLHYQIPREKFEPWTSGFLARRYPGSYPGHLRREI